MGMVLVALDLDVLGAEVVYRGHAGVEPESGQFERHSCDLQPRLLEVIEVEVAVAPGPDELARLEAAHLRHQAGQQAVRGDVERHAEEGVGAPLVELARQPAVVDVELEEGVARHQRHLVELAHVPGGDDDAPAVGLVADQFDSVLDLVDHPPIVGLPFAPLLTVDRPQITLLVGPLVPDPDLVVL